MDVPEMTAEERARLLAMADALGQVEPLTDDDDDHAKLCEVLRIARQFVPPEPNESGGDS